MVPARRLGSTATVAHRGESVVFDMGPWDAAEPVAALPRQTFDSRCMSVTSRYRPMTGSGS